MSVEATAVKGLRDRTGAGFMDCKKALTEVGGDMGKAVDYLRQKGLAAAAKRSGRATHEGIVGSYIHTGGRIGVLIEVNCETDFVARNPQFRSLVKDLAMHVAAANPCYVRREDVPEEVVAREKAIYQAQAQEAGKPEKIWDKIVEGKLEKFYSDACLMEQVFVKDPDGKQTVGGLIRENIARIGENMTVCRFIRFQLGETSQPER